MLAFLAAHWIIATSAVLVAAHIAWVAFIPSPKREDDRFYGEC